MKQPNGFEIKDQVGHSVSLRENLAIRGDWWLSLNLSDNAVRGDGKKEEMRNVALKSIDEMIASLQRFRSKFVAEFRESEVSGGEERG